MTTGNIDYQDVQGTILRGYRVNFARHFILSIVDINKAQQLLKALLQGNNEFPPITSAQRAANRPASFINVSFTCTGLATMGIPESDLKTFDPSFQLGASHPKVAKRVGDVGDSAPEHWLGSLGDNSKVHMLLSLWVRESSAVREDISEKVMAAFAGAVSVLHIQDANALADDKVHFGYRDSIAQPTVCGAPPGKYPQDDQPEVPTGEFLLGYQNALGGTYNVSPVALSSNASYAAFRILEQDVAAFEALLDNIAATTGLTTEMVAAKLCGRWRNGNPLTLAPHQQGPLLPTEQLNNFTYVQSESASDDTLGLTCPIGSHIRRNNPRNSAVIGTDSTHHRIIRRAMPYGAAYNPRQPDNISRGLVGYFINASLKNQFEFLTSQWNLTSDYVKSASAPTGCPAGNAVFNISGEDIFLGVNNPESSSFTFPQEGKNGCNNVNVTGFGRTITTRAGIYCFFPSLSGLNYLANLSPTKNEFYE